MIPGQQLSDLNLLPTRPNWAQGFDSVWQPGEDGANKALDLFLDQALPRYAAERDRPDRPSTSRLSPHLHFGEIGPRQIVQAIQTRQANAGEEAGAESYIRQLGWREFAHHLLFHFPHTPDSPLDSRFQYFRWNEPDPEPLHAWQQGRTGIPLVDAAMRELWQTGWMHNRARMVAASFLVKNLRIHWLEGARWFWDTLVDANLANNTLGWQWVAGCGADAAPYFRIFNPVLQGERFDPAGAYVRRWVPALARMPARYIHQPWQAPAALLESCGVRLGVDYPKPIVDLKTSREQALEAFKRMGKEAGPQ
jgi:deoxyribodipyrimidine photo-lyase